MRTMALYMYAVLFLCVLRVVSGAGDRELYLLTAGNSSDGVVVTFSSEIDSADKVPVITLRDENISAKCGPPLRRCDPLLVVSGVLSNDSDFAFLPLTSGFSILEVSYNGSSLEHREPFVYDIPRETPCSPVLFFESDSDIIMVCVSPSELCYYRIHLNRTYLSSSIAVNPDMIANIDGLQTLSNILPVDCEGVKKGCLVYWIEDKLVRFRIYDNTVKTLFNYGQNCGQGVPILQQVPRLESSRPVVAALCSDRVVYYDFASEDVERVDFYNESGYPYFCPDLPDATVSVYSQSSRIEYTVPGVWNLSASLPGNDFVAGYCLGTKEQPIFLAVDNLTGISAIDITTNSTFKNWTNSQSGQQLSVATIVDQYVVIVGSGGGGGGGGEGMRNVTVLDSNQSFSEVIHASTHADVMTLILGLEKSVPDPDPIPPGSSRNIILATVLPTVVVVLFGVFTAVFVCFCRKRKEREEYPISRRISESEDSSTSYRMPIEETPREPSQELVPELHIHSGPTSGPVPRSDSSQATSSLGFCPQQVTDQESGKVDLATGHGSPHPPTNIHPDSVQRQYQDRRQDNRDGEDLDKKTKNFLHET